MILETERLILRKYKPTDIDDYFEYVSNPNVGPRCGWKEYHSKDDALARLILETTKEHQFAIELKSENKVIGSIELMDYKPERYPDQNLPQNTKEIGFLLSEKYWGQGIMVEATRAVLDFAFNTLKIPVIVISHAEKNLQSARVQEKLGFKIIGVKENYREWIDGKLTNSIQRKMTLEDYKKTAKN